MSTGYDRLLKRARENLPAEIVAHERFQIPEPDLTVEGKTTILRNFEEICGVIRRDPDQVLVNLLREIGTAGTRDGRRVVFKGKVTPVQVTERIRGYVETFVICSECNRPDTHLVKEDRVSILECEACGARRPVKARKPAVKEDEDLLKEGGTYEILIQDISKRGDGVCRLGKYIIYVPGTTKGSTVKIKVDRISGTVVQAQLSRE